MVEVGQLEALIPKAREVSAGLSHDVFNSRVAPGTWSVAECLEHLNVANRLYCEQILIALDEGRRKGEFGDGPFRTSFLERLFVRSIEPPYRMKFKAPKVFQPAKDMRLDLVLDEWEATHRRLLALAKATTGLHLTRVRVSSPVNARLRFSLLATFDVIGAHDRRHLWQALRIREKLGKPLVIPAAT